MRRFLALTAIVLVAVCSARAQRTDLSGLKFCIDPGHGGHNPANDRHVVPDPGTDFWESESNFQKALLLKSLLEARGATVILTRYTNDYPDDSLEPSLAARVAVANSNMVDWFHSIHSNATGLSSNTSINYTLLLVREQIVSGGDPVYGPGTGQPEWPQAYAMSNIIGPAIYAKLRDQPRSTWTYLDWTFYGGSNGGWTLGVLRGLMMPGELSEGSFHDYYPETRRLMNNSYRKMEAYALCYSFMSYFSVPADSLGIIAGIQTDLATSKPINYSRVRLMPLGRIATGDQYNNGFYMFDSLSEGTYTVVFETPGVYADSVQVTLARGATRFQDRVLQSAAAPAVLTSSPVNNDSQVHPLANIVLNFSKPMDTASVRQAFSITPSVSGTITWGASNSQMTFDPDSAFGFLVTYTVQLDTTAHSVTGQTLDGNGDGTPGDPFLLHFTTKYVDIVPPYIVESSPAVLATGTYPTGVLSLMFNEKLQPATVTTTNIAVQKIGGTVQPRIVEYAEINGKAGVSIHLQYLTAPAASYRVRVSGVKDSTGNAVSTSSPILYDFGVGPDIYEIRSLDLLDSVLVQWRDALASAGTIGIDSARLAYTTSSRIRNVLTNPGSVRLSYAFTAGSPDGVAAFEVVPAFADTMCWTRTGHVLQVYLYGDGSGNEFRFTLDDSVEAFPDGPPEHREASRWVPVTWVGWRLVTWDCERDTAGNWTGNGILEGELRFRGIQIRRAAGSGILSGSLLVDLLQLATRTGVVGVPLEPGEHPLRYALEQNFPNPFNPKTVISYQLPAVSDVRLVVYDLLGREVAVLVNDRRGPGRYEAAFDGTNLSSGVYLVRMTAGKYVQTRKILLMK
jgi:N-acetylmuramoyl-L-alanine amidase